MTGWWRRAVLAGTAGGWAICAGASAQETPAFPATLERETLLLWIQRETDILPDRVVAVTPQAITSVVSTFPASGTQGPRLVIRAEALTADTYARAGALSWHVSMTADCQGRRIKLGETTGYPRRNLLGDRKPLRPAETDWRTPEPGTALHSAWRAACETGFKGPFATNTLKMAMDTAPAATPAAKPAPSATAPPPPKPPAQGAAPAAPSSSTPARRVSEMVAQVGAAGSDAEARGLIAALGDRTRGRDTWVETAVVGGKTWHRAVVGGFADAAEAGGFCAGLKAAGRACFIRAGAGR